METKPAPGFVPASLADRIGEALRAAAGGRAEPAAQLRAAVTCLRAALDKGDDRRAALDLLAADALLTSACDVAVGSGGAAMAALASEAAGALAGLATGEDSR